MNTNIEPEKISPLNKEMLPSKAKLTEEKEKKILAYLNTLEKNFLLEVQNNNLFQERIHRINKAISSIKQHSDCYVSDFSFKSTNTAIINNKPSPTVSEQTLNNPHEKPELLKKEEDIEDKSHALKESNIEKNCSDLSDDSAQDETEDVDKLLEYIEKELNIPDKDKNIQSNQDSQTPIKENCQDRRRLSKMFLKIELKVKTHLEEKAIQNSSSLSIQEKKEKQPRSRKSEMLPRLRTNFFEDKEKIAKLSIMKKRRQSCFQGLQGFNMKNSFKKSNNSFKKNLCNSEKCGFISKEAQKVSNFDIGGTEDMTSKNESELLEEEDDSYEDSQDEDSNSIQDFPLLRSSLVPDCNPRCSRVYADNIIHEVNECEEN